MAAISLEERVTGCLLGGAIGDAMGAHSEGLPAASQFRIPRQLRITDDTQLTVATCEAISEAGEVQPESIAAQFLLWFRQRRISGIGASTWKALTELDAGGHWALVGAIGERSAGNGAAMRIAPLAFLLDPEDVGDRQCIRDVCRITHRNDEAYIGALAILYLIRRGLAGQPLQATVFPELVNALPDSRVRDRLSTLRDASWTVSRYAKHFSATGYVVDSVPLAILAAVTASSFSDAIEQIVRCGGDTDTTASMCGQAMGAAGGTNIVPTEWVARLDEAPLVRETARRFFMTLRTNRRNH